MKTKLILACILAFTSALLEAQNWLLAGNGSTTDGVDFLGTTNSVPLTIRVNNQQAGRIDHLLGNAFFGYQAGLSNNNTNGSNSAFGSGALTSNVSGGANAAFGASALAVSTGDGNAAMGFLALSLNTTGSWNAGIGCEVLRNNTTGHHNSALGVEALRYTTSGTYNVAAGNQCMSVNTTGDFVSGLGAAANTSTTNLSYATAVGAYAIVNADNTVWIGAVGDDVWASTGTQLASDRRFKSDVRTEDVKGLEFIKLLRPVVYNFDTKKLTEHLSAGMPGEIRGQYLNRDFTKSTAIRQSGFIAQEVEEAAKKSGYDFSGVHVADPKNTTDIYGLSYATFVVPLVKAVQEQQEIIEKLQKQVEALSGGNASTGISNVSDIQGFSMEQNIPNPFTHETVIKYTLPQGVNTAYMAVYDLTGKQLTSFELNDKAASSITITAEKLQAGIYIYSIVADGKVLDSKRMIVAEK